MLGEGRSGIRIPEMGQKGFTLIELLIVVAILGALAAIVIPNVGRFIGRGEAEAKGTEFANIPSPRYSKTVAKPTGTAPNPKQCANNPTNNMGNFPDTSTCGVSKKRDIYGDEFISFGDKDGYILYGHDRIGNDNDDDLVNYVTTENTSYWYTVDTFGTINQYDTAPP